MMGECFALAVSKFYHSSVLLAAVVFKKCLLGKGGLLYVEKTSYY